VGRFFGLGVLNESVCSCNCARGTARQFQGGRQVMEWTKGMGG
jgi:hypothetical protein